MIAFTFPGQGSQKPGMGRSWVDHPSWELVGEASTAAGRDVGHLLLDADADELRQTRNAQLATFVLEPRRARRGRAARASSRPGSPATASASTPRWPPPARVDFDDGVRLVVERGEAMQAAAEDRAGTMAAVLGLDDDEVEIACRRADGDVWVANYNAPGQVVIAGDPVAIDAAGGFAKDLGAKQVMPLAVGGAFHTPFMAPARDRLRKALDEVDLRDRDVPVIANVDARPHTEADEWAALLAAQLCSPVRWRQTLYDLDDDGRHHLRRARSGHRAHRPGQAHGRPALEPSRSPRPTTSTACSRPSPGIRPHVGAEGEHLFMTERLVVSPAAGVFAPTSGSPRASR